METATSPFSELRIRLDHAEQRLLALVSPVHAAARRRRPARDKWCLDEIVDHLARTVEQYYRPVEAALASAKARGGRKTSTLRHRFCGRFLIKALEPGSRPVSAPRIFRPRESAAGESAAHDAIGRFKQTSDKLRSWMDQAATIESSEATLGSPAMFLIRLNIDDVLVTLVMHLERHIGQVERTIEALKQ